MKISHFTVKFEQMMQQYVFGEVFKSCSDHRLPFRLKEFAKRRDNQIVCHALQALEDYIDASVSLLDCMTLFSSKNLLKYPSGIVTCNNVMFVGTITFSAEYHFSFRSEVHDVKLRTY